MIKFALRKTNGMAEGYNVTPKGKIKNIFFDFDGVLAESVQAKTEAFHTLYLPYGQDIANLVVEHHLEHGGMSRFEKFKHYHNTFLNTDIDESRVQELASDFSQLVLQNVIEADEVIGAREFLSKYFRNHNFFIITGTPTQEIKTILNARQMDHYFIEACGSPEKKPYWVDHLIRTFNINPDETLFLGDAMTDYEAALHGKLHFALREHEENLAYFSDFKGLRFKDFIELEQQIENFL